MDMGCFCFSVWIMMVCLVGSARLLSSENCICPKIPLRHHTEPPADTGKCFQLLDRFRYNCIQDYVRKVGTSNLIICKNISGTVQWTAPTLECIPHPDKPKPTNSTQFQSSIPNDSIFTTTVTETSTILLSDRSVSPTPFPSGGNNSLRSTSQETVTQTTNICTTQKSTLSPVTDNNTTSTEQSGQDIVNSVGISLMVLTVICSMIGLGFFLHRRRSRRNIPEGTAKEMDQLTLPSGQP